MVDILVGVFRELPAWFILSLGFFISLRILRFPDLTVEASFLGGTAGAAWGAMAYNSSIAGLVAAVSLGALAGALTSALYALNRTSLFKLLAGLLVLFSFFSVNYRVLDEQTSVNFYQSDTFINGLINLDHSIGWSSVRPITTLVIYLLAFVVFALLYYIFRTEHGLVLRTVGYRPQIVEDTGNSSSAYLTVGLIGTNIVVGVGGWIYASTNSVADITTYGIVLHALASVIIGEIVFRYLFVEKNRYKDFVWFLSIPLLGSILYTFIRHITIWFVTKKVGTGESVSILMPKSQDLNMIFSIILVLVMLSTKLISVRGDKLTREAGQL